MKCPDCQGILGRVSLTGFDESYRCQACGGFWMQSWVVNKVVMEDMSQWSRLGMTAGSDLKTNKCPADGEDLSGVDPTQIPERVRASKCDKCSWWWFPGDNLFDFKVAQVARVNYFKWWGKPGELARLAMPAVMVVLLTVGLGVGLTVIRSQTGLMVPAAVEASDVRIEKIAGGTAVISFRAARYTGQVEYALKGTSVWKQVKTTLQEGKYLVRIEGLELGGAYVVRIGGGEYGFIAE